MAKEKKKKQGPDLDKYLEGRKKRYTTYHIAARIYSIPYYAFVRMAKEANATWKVRKTAIVDLDIFDAYLESKKS